MTDDATIRRLLRGLPKDEQRATAVAMASVVLPLGELTEEGQPEGGLAAVADVVRRSGDHVAVDRARHLIWSMPEMAEDEEPEERTAWFAFGASIAWLYAADAVLTAPSDGVANCLSRVEDLLESVDDDLDTHLHDDLLEALASDDATGALAALGLRVEQEVRRLADR